jgi:alcohol dehydrogenase, propanol-preferring
VKAFRIPAWGESGELTEVAVPAPRAGEVLLRVEAAGICHSDLHVLDAPAAKFPYPVPFTLGHEIAGRVARMGPDATGVALGERVVVHGPWGCGNCRRCRLGHDNYCDRRATLTWAGAGLGRDGGMADYVLVPDARHLVPIGDLDATQAAPLSDAGLTPYHAIAAVAGRLGEGSTAAVIGVGGLGHLAIQILRAVTASRVYAVDVRESSLELAHESGAHVAVLAKPDTRDVLRGTDGLDAVFDFVGSTSTLELAASSLRPGGDLVIVGSGGGTVTVSKPGPLPQGGRVSLPFWGTRPELAEVIELARTGLLRVEVECFPLSAAADALALVRAGRVRGRAVVVPEEPGAK